MSAKMQTFGWAAAPLNSGCDMKPKPGGRLGVITVDGRPEALASSPALAAVLAQAPRLHDALMLARAQLEEAYGTQDGAPLEAADAIENRRKSVMTTVGEAIAAWDKASAQEEKPRGLIQPVIGSALDRLGRLRR